MHATSTLVIPEPVKVRLTSYLRQRASGGREAFAILLCGLHSAGGRTRLLARHLILPEEDCFTHRSAGGLALDPAFDAILMLAEEESLWVVHFHTHPWDQPPEFSTTDTVQERARAVALHRAMGVGLGSVVFNQSVTRHSARLWRADRCQPLEMSSALSLDQTPAYDSTPKKDAQFDRQVRAFGIELQARLQRLRVGIVGLGGLGGEISVKLAHLGVRQFVLVDPDRVQRSNLNRLPGATLDDVRLKMPKTEVARRQIVGLHGQHARVTCIDHASDSAQARRALPGCDVLIAATDNHTSRLQVQDMGSRYLRQVIHAGVGLQGKAGQIHRIMGRVSAPPLGGSWCLACGGMVDLTEAARETAGEAERARHAQRGYLPGTPDPAVVWVNAQIAAQAVEVLHDLVLPFRPHARRGQGKDLVVDLLERQTFEVDHGTLDDAQSGCAVCGLGAIGLGDCSVVRRVGVAVLPVL